MARFDLRTSNLGRPLARRRSERDEEALEWGVLGTGDVDENRRDRPTEIRRLQVLLRQDGRSGHRCRDHFGKQLLLRAKVAIDQHGGDAGASGDLPYTGTVVPGSRKGRSRGIEDGLAGGAGIPWSWCRRGS